MNEQECERKAEMLFEQRRIQEALYWFEQGLKRGSDPRRNALRRWESWMMLGEFERAWIESDRFPDGASAREGPLGRLLVHCDRGLGDAIQFLRFAPQLKRRCNKLIVQGPERLLPLLELLPGIDEALVSGGAVDCDSRIECSNLPYLC